jgi:prolyl oligopeptidase
MNDKVGTEGDTVLHQRIYYHRINTPQCDDVLVFQCNEQPTWLFGVEITDDGRYLVISVSESCDPKNLLYICDLQQASGFGTC